MKVAGILEPLNKYHIVFALQIFETQFNGAQRKMVSLQKFWP